MGGVAGPAMKWPTALHRLAPQAGHSRPALKSLERHVVSGGKQNGTNEKVRIGNFATRSRVG